MKSTVTRLLVLSISLVFAIGIGTDSKMLPKTQTGQWYRTIATRLINGL